jgi:Hemerythrin HHE cation binding domain
LTSQQNGEVEMSDGLGVHPTAPPERLSAVSLWDETTRPSGPGASSGARYSAHGQAVAGHLVEVHDHLRTELTQIRDLILQVRDSTTGVDAARSAINQMTLRSNSWTLGAYCASYCRVVTGHHSLEDQAIFPHLRAREPALHPVLDRLAEEHEIIHKVLGDLDAELVELLRGPATSPGCSRRPTCSPTCCCRICPTRRAS